VQRVTQNYAPLQRRPSYKRPQTAKQTLTTSKDLIEFTHSDFPCNLKMNRDTLALISRLWKCKNGERLMITANSFTKIVDYRSTRRIPPAVAVQMRKFRPLQEPIRSQDLFNSARSRAQKKIKKLNLQAYLAEAKQPHNFYGKGESCYVLKSLTAIWQFTSV